MLQIFKQLTNLDLVLDLFFFLDFLEGFTGESDLLNDGDLELLYVGDLDILEDLNLLGDRDSDLQKK